MEIKVTKQHKVQVQHKGRTEHLIMYDEYKNVISKARELLYSSERKYVF